MAVLFDATGSNPSVPSAGSDRPIVLDWVELDIDTDAVGQILLYQFPDVAFLPNRPGAVRLFMVDAPGGSFAGGLDITGSDGVSDYDIAANEALVQNECFNSTEVNGGGAYIDVGGLYVTLDISVVGTSTACTVQLGVEYTQNVIKKAIVAS